MKKIRWPKQVHSRNYYSVRHYAKPLALFFFLIMSTTPALAVVPSDATFMTQINAAMTKMMADMNIKPSGNIDNDFVLTMVPHHQGAIDMAIAELRYGHNKQLQRIAQEIIITQQQEIAAMRLAVGQPLPPSVPAPDQIPQN